MGCLAYSQSLVGAVPRWAFEIRTWTVRVMLSNVGIAVEKDRRDSVLYPYKENFSGDVYVHNGNSPTWAIQLKVGTSPHAGRCSVWMCKSAPAGCLIMGL